MRVVPRPGDALVVVDVQADFVSGSLAVPGAERILPILNRYIAAFRAKRLPVVATRDWHPPDHASFAAQNGPWPAHCVAGTAGAEFARGLSLPGDVHVISKATLPHGDAYSGFEGTTLDALLYGLRVRRLFVGGLATDYCVLHTVKDALEHGYEVLLLVDAIRAVEAAPGDGEAAMDEMLRRGARALRLEELVRTEQAHG